MNVLKFVPEETRKNVAKQIRVVADKLEAADSTIVNELCYVAGQVIGTLKVFGVDPQQLAHSYLDKLFVQVDELSKKGRGRG